MVSILCGQSGNIMNAMNIKSNDVGATLGAFASLNTPWSPLAWAGHGLLDIGQSNWLPGLGLTALSLLLAGALFGGTLYLAEQLYYNGWASMQGSVQRKRGPRNAVKPTTITTPTTISGTLSATAAGAAATAPALVPARVPVIARWISAPVRGMIVKDLLLLRRDPRNLSQLITPLILGFVMMFTTRGGGRNTRAALEKVGVANIEMYLVIVLAIFVGWMLMMNLASLAFTREGRSYWILKASPVGPWQLLAGKFIVSYLPSASLSLLFILISYVIRGMNWAFLPYSLPIVALSIAGATAIALAYGAAGANLEWDSPHRQRLRGAGGCLMVIVVSLFLLVDLALFLLPPGIWQILAAIRGVRIEAPLVAYLIGLLLGGAAALVGVFVPLRLVAPRLARIGEVE
jgi:hypothetical protein